MCLSLLRGENGFEDLIKTPTRVTVGTGESSRELSRQYCHKFFKFRSEESGDKFILKPIRKTILRQEKELCKECVDKVLHVSIYICVRIEQTEV